MKEFNVGDLVRHRASHRGAVVIGVEMRCINHSRFELCCLNVDRSLCNLQPTGCYDLSFDFGDESQSAVDGILLELVEGE